MTVALFIVIEHVFASTVNSRTILSTYSVFKDYFLQDAQTRTSEAKFISFYYFDVI